MVYSCVLGFGLRSFIKINARMYEYREINVPIGRKAFINLQEKKQITV
jgi:hypothetical protein